MVCFITVILNVTKHFSVKKAAWLKFPLLKRLLMGLSLTTTQCNYIKSVTLFLKNSFCCLHKLALYLLGTHLVSSLILVVDATEVGHYDRNRKCDHQDAAQRADGAEDFAGDGFRNHVSISATPNRHVCLDKNGQDNSIGHNEVMQHTPFHTTYPRMKYLKPSQGTLNGELFRQLVCVSFQIEVLRNSDFQMPV